MQRNLGKFVVTAAQMRSIEERIFAAGMPVAALMEKVAGLITQHLQIIWQKSARKNPETPFPQRHPWTSIPQERHLLKVGVLVGPGHNGGDGFVVARELHFQGYPVLIYQPFSQLKELTHHQAQYAASLGIPIVKTIEPLQDCHLLIDGLFGFGLERTLTGSIAETIQKINTWNKPIFSIDIPSGLNTDTGEVLGIAIRATHTFCLGLWKLAFLQDAALEYIGTSELIDFDIPLADITAILGESPTLQRLTADTAIPHLPLPRHPNTHKYQNGHLLIIAGSRRYTGAAILAGLGARATGIGMLSIAVPESLKPLLCSQLPEALIIACPETETGAIRQLPFSLDLNAYHTIACGPGLTLEAAAIVELVLDSNPPLVLDADGLNTLAQFDTLQTLSQRLSPTVITPHPGEFKRLFPHLNSELSNRVIAAQKAAQHSNAILVLKGAKVVIASHLSGDTPTVWINPESTAALARGGSGDVLTGLLGGLLAQTDGGISAMENAVTTAVWWHAQAGMRAAQERTELGVDALTLTQYLIPTLAKWMPPSSLLLDP